MATTASRTMTRVLIHEPHPEVRTFLVRLVEHLGYEPVVSGSGEPPDGDVLLLAASAEDGLALAASLRRANPDLPVVCAGSGPPGREVLALGPVAFLVKPFTIGECEQALAEASALVPAHLP